MQPFSSFPQAPSPRDNPPNLPNLRRVVPVLLTALLIGAVIVVFTLARGGSSAPRTASGPAATATSMSDATDVPTTDPSTPAPGATPSATSGGGTSTQTGAVRVTQNQDERQPCINEPAPYTVTLFNAGTVTANWKVNVPTFYGSVPDNSRPLMAPLSSYPYWAEAAPSSGSVAPGQTISFLMTVYYGMPCGTTLYHATVQLSFPVGFSQPDIPLTFGGTGPARYSNVILVSGSLTNTAPCPPSGVAPEPFTFAIKNTGNYFGVPYVVIPETGPGLKFWTNTQYVADIQEPVSTWLYPGETWTFTVSPIAGLNCGGATYSFELQVNNAQGTTTSMTFTDTFN